MELDEIHETVPVEDMEVEEINWKEIKEEYTLSDKDEKTLKSEILKDKIITEKKKGKLVLITSHILSELDELVTQVIYMQEGKLIFHKSIEDLRADTGQEKLSKAIASVMLKMQ